MAEPQLNLYQKLAKIRAGCEVILKSKSGYSYKYAPLDQILALVTANMKKYGVSLITTLDQDSVSVVPREYTKTKVTRDGKVLEEKVTEFVASGNVTFTWIDDAEPDNRIDMPWCIIGSQSDPSQALGAALTYCTRYFLMQQFNIAAVETDPDEWRSRQKEAEDAEDIRIAKQIIEQVDQTVNAFIERYPDGRADMIAAIKRHVKDKGKPSANYNLIKDPRIAAQLLEEVNSMLEKADEEQKTAEKDQKSA